MGDFSEDITRLGEEYARCDEWIRRARSVLRPSAKQTEVRQKLGRERQKRITLRRDLVRLMNAQHTDMVTVELRKKDGGSQAVHLHLSESKGRAYSLPQKIVVAMEEFLKSLPDPHKPVMPSEFLESFAEFYPDFWKRENEGSPDRWFLRSRKGATKRPASQVQVPATQQDERPPSPSPSPPPSESGESDYSDLDDDDKDLLLQE